MDRSSLLLDVHLLPLEAEVIDGGHLLDRLLAQQFPLLGEGLLLLPLLRDLLLAREVSVVELVLAELEVLVALGLSVLEVLEVLLLVTVGTVVLLLLFLQLDLNLVSSRQFLLALYSFNTVFFEYVFLGENNLTHICYHPLLDLQIYL